MADDHAHPRDQRTRVLLTGATGNWGRATLRELRERADRVRVIALCRPGEQSRTALRQFDDMDNLEIVWGDLTDYEIVASCVGDVDLVVHLGGLVSPLADDHPELTRRVNIGGMRNIISAVAALPDPSRVGVVGVGSVAETGDRNPPQHWGRVGDPLRVSRFDEYGQTKVVAEKALVDSGLPKWVWLRQTGIFHPALIEIRDPIMTHSPLDGALEWASAEDSARLVANLCEPELPPEFWGDIYNIGGGEGWRLTNWQLLVAIGAAMGVRDVTRWYDRDWFALKNFHGHWFTDSDRLEQLVPFREDTLDDALARAVAQAPASVRHAGSVPPWLVKQFVMKSLSRKQRGTMAAVRGGNEQGIAAFFGSLENWRRIGDWSTFTPLEPSRTPTYLDHGFDESKSPGDWTKADYIEAAAFRGGELLDTDPVPGNAATPLNWRCAFGHEFTGSPRLILTAGHWCPDCITDTGRYAEQAERNAFLAQAEGAR
ncbi:MAG TPA: NAD-dependent epimerase/dehydratase family protein [Humibacter sp.]|nr:NAD-dependent epimerase/dehydratase family protein [Humibacter sp.]